MNTKISCFTTPGTTAPIANMLELLQSLHLDSTGKVEATIRVDRFYESDIKRTKISVEQVFNDGRPDWVTRIYRDVPEPFFMEARNKHYIVGLLEKRSFSDTNFKLSEVGIRELKSRLEEEKKKEMATA